jgi:hypothetical protein
MIFTLSSRENEGAMVSKLDEQVVSRSRDDIFLFHPTLPFRGLMGS